MLIERKKLIPKHLLKLQKKLTTFFNKTYNNFYKFDINTSIEILDTILWRDFAKYEQYPQLTYHLRAIAEKIKNINKYSLGIHLKNN